MPFENALYNFLSANLTIPDEITANKTPQSTQNNYLQYQRIDSNRDYAHDGSLKLVFADYQFDAYSTRKSNAIAIKKDLQEKLEDFNGYMGDYRVQGVFLTNEFDLYEDDTKLYREEVEYRIQYKE